MLYVFKKTSASFSLFISPRLSSSPRYSFVLPREARIARDSRFISVSLSFSSEFSTELLSVFFLNILLGLTFL